MTQDGRGEVVYMLGSQAFRTTGSGMEASMELM